MDVESVRSQLKIVNETLENEKIQSMKHLQKVFEEKETIDKALEESKEAEQKMKSKMT